MEALLRQVKGHYKRIKTLEPYLVAPLRPDALGHPQHQRTRLLHVVHHVFRQHVGDVAEHLAIEWRKQLEQALDDECKLGLVRRVICDEDDFLLEEHATEQFGYVVQRYGAEECLEGEVRLEEGPLREHDVGLCRHLTASDSHALPVCDRFRGWTQQA